MVIVIAVIAILAAVLIPTFGNVIQNAKESAAMQEARNAYAAYLAEYAGTGSVDEDLYVEVEEGKWVEIAGGTVKVTDGKVTILTTKPDGDLIEIDSTSDWDYKYTQKVAAGGSGTTDTNTGDNTGEGEEGTGN